MLAMQKENAKKTPPQHEGVLLYFFCVKGMMFQRLEGSHSGLVHYLGKVAGAKVPHEFESRTLCNLLYGECYYNQLRAIEESHGRSCSTDTARGDGCHVLKFIKAVVKLFIN